MTGSVGAKGGESPASTIPKATQTKREQKVGTFAFGEVCKSKKEKINNYLPW
jgi:hypothetical protein